MIVNISNRPIIRMLKVLIQSSLLAAVPNQTMKQAIMRKSHHLFVNSIQYDLSNYQRIVCVGAGKASAHMAKTLEQILGKYLEGGMVIVKDGYKTDTKKIHVA